MICVLFDSEMLLNKWFYYIFELVYGGENDNCDGYISGLCFF